MAAIPSVSYRGRTPDSFCYFLFLVLAVCSTVYYPAGMHKGTLVDATVDCIPQANEQARQLTNVSNMNGSSSLSVSNVTGIGWWIPACRLWQPDLPRSATLTATETWY